MKKLFAFLLSALLVFQTQLIIFAENVTENSESTAYKEVIPFNGLDLVNTCGDNLTWNISEDGVLTINGTGEMDSWPTPYYPGWYSLREEIKEVVIADGVTSIGDWAFNNLTALEKITIPGSVLSIGDGALSACKSLTSIVIPEKTVSIGKSVFRESDKLESIELPADITIIPEQAFYNCTALKEVKTSDKLSSIGDDAFYGCSSLTSFEIKSNVASIGKRAFYGCSSLDSVSVPSGVKIINESTFYNCSSLKSIELSENITSIGKNVFEGCSLLSDVTLPKKLSSLDAYAFKNCSVLESITLPENITSIGIGVFMGCKALNDIKLPENLKTVSSSCFSGCTSLTDIEIPASITTIGDYVFSGCIQLKNVKINEGFKKISSSMFFNCSALKTIVLPASVNYIGSYAFEGCTSLSNVICLTKDAKCNTDLFAGCKNVTVYCYKDSTAEEYATANKINYTLIDDISLNMSLTENEGEITVSASSSNTIGDVQYKFYHVLNGEETVLKDYSEDSSYTFTLETAGEYKIFTEVTDLRGVPVSAFEIYTVEGEEPEPKADVFVFKIDDENIYYANDDVKFTAGTAPFMQDGKAIVPLRSIAAAAGISDLKYDAATKKITFTGFDGYKVEMQSGSTNCTLTKGDETINLTIVAPFTKDGSAMLPLRDTTNLVGGYVKYSDHYIVVSKDAIDDADIAGYISAYDVK